MGVNVLATEVVVVTEVLVHAYAFAGHTSDVLWVWWW